MLRGFLQGATAPAFQIHSLRYCRIKSPYNKTVLTMRQINMRASQNNHVGGGRRSLLFKPDLDIILKTYTLLVHPLLCKNPSVTATKTGLARIKYYHSRSDPTSRSNVCSLRTRTKGHHMSLQTLYWVSGTAPVQIIRQNGERGDGRGIRCKDRR